VPNWRGVLGIEIREVRGKDLLADPLPCKGKSIDPLSALPKTRHRFASKERTEIRGEPPTPPEVKLGQDVSARGIQRALVGDGRFL
jgi:hypothetical protein